MTELATKTMTAETRIGSQSDPSGTMCDLRLGDVGDGE
jgi:hypothetical protein